MVEGMQADVLKKPDVSSGATGERYTAGSSLEALPCSLDPLLQSPWALCSLHSAVPVSIPSCPVPGCCPCRGPKRWAHLPAFEVTLASSTGGSPHLCLPHYSILKPLPFWLGLTQVHSLTEGSDTPVVGSRCVPRHIAGWVSTRARFDFSKV